MDPTYQQAMIQQLMQQQGQTNPMMAGQNPATPYGQSFMTGGQAMPGMGMLGNQAPDSQQLQQAQATYPGMGY